MERIYKFSIESESETIGCQDHGTYEQMMDLYEKAVKQFDEHYENHPEKLKERTEYEYDYECLVTKYLTVDDEVVITFDIIPMYEDGDDFTDEIERYLN